MAKAVFSGATYTKRAERADFFKATFMAEAYFPGAIFTKEAYFSEVTFTKEANFSGATFKEEAVFPKAIFKAGADFYRATFTEKADFLGATIEGLMVFRDLNPSEEGKPPPPSFQGDFRYLALSPGAALWFQDLSLAQSEFAGTDLRLMHFINVKWPCYRGRNVVYDEMVLKKKPTSEEYAQVEHLYLQLIANYKNQEDYKRVGDFHYGEMEMDRRASPSRRWFSWYSIYWTLSGYGERPCRALVCLIAFLFGFSLLVWHLGLAIDGYGNWAGFNESFIYILQKVTLQRPEWPKAYTYGAQFWSSLSVFLIPGQAALFLLALRNRLGRRR